MHKKVIFGTFELIKKCFKVFGFMLLSVAWLVAFKVDINDTEWIVHRL